ncbi:hypothetical protein UlMin_008931 [Ulmus minor]
MEEKQKSGEEDEPKASLFPLLPISNPKPSLTTTAISSTSTATSNQPQWLCNSSFTADLSLINDAVSRFNSQPEPPSEDEEEAEEEHERSHGRSEPKPSQSYEQLESSESDRASGSDGRERRSKKKKRSRKKRKSERYDERSGGFDDYGSRRSNVRAWADSDRKPSKEYFFDSRGDRDNLVFGSLYRMDVARYKPVESPGLGFQGFGRWNRRGSTMDRDDDVDALDNKLKSGGRYWSAKYMALESQKNLKRVRVLVPKGFSETVSDDFVPLSDVEASSLVEESWEDEVLRKTREFNKLTRERPNDEKTWLEFAEFQDKVASMQSQKGARLQTLEKKISILEKAAELNPDSEELLLCLLKAYQRRDGTDVLIGRWEKILMQNSGNYKLWREFLYFFQGEFSMFKVSEMRKMYSNAIQALSAACSKHSRQVHQAAKPPLDSSLVQLELGLVDIFINLCRFEWQAGYQELATALFQAEMEYSLFSPSLLLTEQSKQRLFEHFWNSDGARVGEEGALGWCTWLEKEEENRQRIIREEATADAEEEGGWTGWSEPLAKNKISGGNPENQPNIDMEVEEMQTELEAAEADNDSNQEDDNEALLKKLGIDVDAASGGEVKDASTWTKWSEEELLRDHDQWMPIRAKSGVLPADGTPDPEADEHLLRVILYEDVNEFLFSLSSFEARLSLLFQFVDFFGGKISQWICTNSSSWIEKTLSLDELPDSLLQILRKFDDLRKLNNSSSGSSLEFLLGNVNNISQRTEMMKFLRNATLLCLTAFPRNHILEEAALVAEELFVTKMNSSSCSVTPSRALAKQLLKSDRQDILFCGVYARREASYGNIDHARRVFDMALLSVEGLPLELKSNAPLIYLWYAEMELANDNSSSHAMHILSCLGNGAAYGTFKGQPSSLQLLRAHQGFKEKLRTVRSSWVRGVIDDQSVSLVCSAALFEELTSGRKAGIEVLDQAFAMVLPERMRCSSQIEFLFNFYVSMLQRHLDHLNPSKCWESIFQGLQIFPFNPELFSALVRIGHLYSTPNKLRRIFDEFCPKKQSVVVWLFALSFEISRGGSQYRIHGLFERALANDKMRNSVLLWRCYIAYETNIACDPHAARRIFFRAIHACPWSKRLWVDGFIKLGSILSGKELSDLQEVMRDKELNLRTDIYEILLRDELVS